MAARSNPDWATQQAAASERKRVEENCLTRHKQKLYLKTKFTQEIGTQEGNGSCDTPLCSRTVVLNLWVMTPWSQATLLQGLPKTIGKHRYLHYDS